MPPKKETKIIKPIEPEKTVEKKEIKKETKIIKPIDKNIDMLDENNIDYRQILLNYDISKNITSPRITKYECSLIIGKRAEMIQQNANPNIKPLPGQTAIEIAEQELKEGKIPFIIRRQIGNIYEYFKLQDMEIVMQ